MTSALPGPWSSPRTKRDLLTAQDEPTDPRIVEDCLHGVKSLFSCLVAQFRSFDRLRSFSSTVWFLFTLNACIDNSWYRGLPTDISLYDLDINI